MAVHSRYLAQLPHSCAHAADSVPLAPKDAHITRQPAGLHLQYNFEQGTYVLFYCNELASGPASVSGTHASEHD